MVCSRVALDNQSRCNIQNNRTINNILDNLPVILVCLVQVAVSIDQPRRKDSLLTHMYVQSTDFKLSVAVEHFLMTTSFTMAGIAFRELLS